jgi:hypothetical protein
MSHPYWPQPSYIFRRQKAAPVPDAYGNYEFGASPGPKAGKGSGKVPTAYDIGPSGAQAKKHGLGAVSLRALQKTYGSLSPKTDWATPRYIRNEPSGLGAFGDDNCLSSVIGTVAGKVDGWVSSIPGIGSVISTVGSFLGFSVAGITKDALNKAVGGFSAYFTGGDAAAHKSEMVASIMNVLPEFPEQVPGLETYRGQIAQRIVDELINATACCMAGGGGGSGGGGFNLDMSALQAHYKEICAAGSEGMTAEMCSQMGYPFMTGGFQMMQLQMVDSNFLKAVYLANNPTAFQPMQIDASKVGAQLLVTPKPASSSSTMLIAGAAILAYLLIK